MSQKIRKSQFILTYGPGAIIESVRGPRLVLNPSIALFAKEVKGKKLSPLQFEINHQRLSEGLLGGARIFSVPSNGELGLDENIGLYDTKPFPGWGLCVDHGILYRINNGCPECKRMRSINRPGRREAIRFVRACPAGHLDDVDWNWVVHSRVRRGCTSNWFFWQSHGSSLKDIAVKCPICGAEVTLGEIYNRTWPCSGRFPEQERDGIPNRPGCEYKSRIIQRQASNLRVPEIVTLFTIPPRHTALHRLLENSAIRTGLSAMSALKKQFNPENFRDLLEGLKNDNLISRTVYDEILKHSWEEIERAIEDIRKEVPSSFRGLLLEEFHELIKASKFGATGTGSQILFEVIKEDVVTVKSPSGKSFRVTPISRLNTVTVQRGYRRFVTSEPAEAELVDISFTDENQNRWLPGVEFLGEGIFIMLDGDEGWHFPMSGDSYERWLAAYDSASNCSGKLGSPALFRDQNYSDELHPVFVWWHTMAHIIIRILSVNSGYSAASIRERIYFEINSKGRARGGILIYTVQPGADGTLGGLIALTPHFGEILSQVPVMAERCSNDPLCAQMRFESGKSRGAACYACAMVSETSCEHRNLWLDRHILMENVP
jgi:hypothetical protein